MVNIEIDYKFRVIVTGQMRSGTSLVLQLLNEWGIPIYGDKFPSRYLNKYDENPEGFWEHDISRNGISVNTPEMYERASKLFIPAIKKSISPLPTRGIVFCIRNPADMVLSIQKMRKSLNELEIIIETMQYYFMWYQLVGNYNVLPIYLDYGKLINGEDIGRLAKYVGVSNSSNKVVKLALHRQRNTEWRYRCFLTDMLDEWYDNMIHGRYDDARRSTREWPVYCKKVISPVNAYCLDMWPKTEYGMTYCKIRGSNISRGMCKNICPIYDKSSPISTNSMGKFPPLYEQAVSLSKAVIKQVAAGNPERTGEELERVRNICNSCEFFVKEKERCIKCGCYMTVKRRWATSNCKIGKW